MKRTNADVFASARAQRNVLADQSHKIGGFAHHVHIRVTEQSAQRSSPSHESARTRPPRPIHNASGAIPEATDGPHTVVFAGVISPRGQRGNALCALNKHEQDVGLTHRRDKEPAPMPTGRARFRCLGCAMWLVGEATEWARSHWESACGPIYAYRTPDICMVKSALEFSEYSLKSAVSPRMPQTSRFRPPIRVSDAPRAR